jgi:GNAT superfamily N-acetyltransferase
LIFADSAIARLLEGLCAEENVRFVEAARALYPGSGAEAMLLGGGAAIYVGPDSPVNQASGIGLDGPVEADTIEAVARFFSQRASQPRINLCPLAHPSLARAVAELGWVVDCFENVLALDLAEHQPRAGEKAEGVEIRRAETDDERELWASVVSNGFAAPADPSAAQLRLGRIVAMREGAVLLTAYVDGRPAGTGELTVGKGVGWLSADTTLPQFRRRGIQRALQEERLHLAAEAGCSMAVSESQPGASSQRNMERSGFHVLYTRADVVGPMGRAGDEHT